MKRFMQVLVKGTAVTLSGALFIGFLGFLAKEHHVAALEKQEALLKQQHAIAIQVAVVAERSRFLEEQFGADVFTIAQMFDGEAEATPEEWEVMFSAVVARFESGNYGDTLEETVKWCRKGYCQVNAMADNVMEFYGSSVGIMARLKAAELVEAYNAGTFRPFDCAHSWATPETAAGDTYFQKLYLLKKVGDHNYYCNKPLRPRIRPNDLVVEAAAKAG